MPPNKISKTQLGPLPCYKTLQHVALVHNFALNTASMTANEVGIMKQIEELEEPVLEKIASINQGHTRYLYQSKDV